MKVGRYPAVQAVAHRFFRLAPSLDFRVPLFNKLALHTNTMPKIEISSQERRESPLPIGLNFERKFRWKMQQNMNWKWRSFSQSFLSRLGKKDQYNIHIVKKFKLSSFYSYKFRFCTEYLCDAPLAQSEATERSKCTFACQHGGRRDRSLSNAMPSVSHSLVGKCERFWLNLITLSQRIVLHLFISLHGLILS